MSTPQAITPEGVTKHMTALLGTNVTAKKLPTQDSKGKQVYALVQDESGALVCVILCDIPAAGSCGAALSKIPAGAVQEIMRKNELLDEDLLANFHEIANVLTVLTTATLGRRNVLRKVGQSMGLLEPEVDKMVKGAKTKLFLRVAIQGYPPGAVNFYLAT
jgi:hypothetical protein